MARRDLAGHIHFNMSIFQTILGGLVAAALVFVFFRREVARRNRAAGQVTTLFADVAALLDNPSRKPGDSAGSWTLTGRWGGADFQFTTIVDTLAVRKLPVLWLMLTLPRPQKIPATIDMVMRPAGPTTFSKFDFLPHGLALPSGFPVEAVIRSDGERAHVPDAMAAALPVFLKWHGKELLLSPKGLRMVLRLAEAERGRYVVLREARFDGTHITADMAQEAMTVLLQLEKDLKT